jgi:uncharacterized membrane protein HdeD (DUF308 family)
MNLTLRAIRFIILLLSGLAAIFLNQIVDGFSGLFGIALTISAALTVIYLFLQFDKPINEKVVMELIADGFSGIVIFTYPQSDDRFFLVVFSFWIVWMGILCLASGLLDKKHEKLMWLYTLLGIMFVVFGFIIMNYTDEMFNSAIYLVGFIMNIYSLFGLYTILLRKSELY